LRYIVVQLTRKPGALLFLRIDQTSAQHVRGPLSLQTLDVRAAQALAMHQQHDD
jgi:hypothetical protein